MVLTFINKFKIAHKEELEDVFIHGYCYWFAHILATRFKGTLYYNPVKIHFATMIKDKLYDITGEIKDKTNWMTWTQYQEEEHEIAMDITRSCILKIKKGDVNGDELY